MVFSRQAPQECEKPLKSLAEIDELLDNVGNVVKEIVVVDLAKSGQEYLEGDLEAVWSYRFAAMA